MRLPVVQVLFLIFLTISSSGAFAIDDFGYGRSSSPNDPIEPYGGYEGGRGRGDVDIEPKANIRIRADLIGGLMKFSLHEPVVLIAPEIDEKPIVIEVDLVGMTARLTGSQQVETSIRIEYSDTKNAPNDLIIEHKKGSVYKEIIFSHYQGRHGIQDKSGNSIPVISFWVTAEGQFSSILYGGQQTKIERIEDQSWMCEEALKP